MNPSGKKRHRQINLSRSCGHESLMKNVNRLGFQGDLNTYQFLACVAWRFWLGALSNKGGRGQRNREEIEAGARLDKTAMLRRLTSSPKFYSIYS